ncbi:MAG: M55 family metallopeptidase [Bacillota bacterium]|jgi:D-amino peptidase
MKVYISVDMEGGTGVASAKHMREAGYVRMCKLLTQDVNAAIDGAFEAGATEVLVNDAHGSMTNILIEDLDERASLISGSNKHLLQMEGLDETYDAAFFIGYHAHEGNQDAVLNHTIYGGAVTEIKRNGVVVGETAINAGIAGHFGVPVALVVGDHILCAEAKSFLGDIETVAVKEAIDRYAAKLLSPKRSQALIKEGAKRALRRLPEIQPHKIAAPVEFQITTKLTSMAHMCTLFPSVERRGPKVIAVRSDCYLSAYQQLMGCLIISGATGQGWL